MIQNCWLKPLNSTKKMSKRESESRKSKKRQIRRSDSVMLGNKRSLERSLRQRKQLN